MNRKNTTLIQLIEEIGGKTLVFTTTKIAADQLGTFLSDKGFQADCFHGDLLQSQREQILGDFRSGKFSILVATDVAARGFDIEGVSHVINYDLPLNIDDYVHRIGRTGRAGNKGMATSFYTDKNASILKPLISVMEETNQTIDEWMYNESKSDYFRTHNYNRSYGRGSPHYYNDRYETDNSETRNRRMNATNPQRSMNRKYENDSTVVVGDWKK